MIAPYRPARPESGPSGSGLASVAEALTTSIDEMGGQRQVAQLIDVARSTLQQWGGDPDAWRSAKLLEFARCHAALGDSIIAFIRGAQPPEAHPTAAIPEACEAVQLCGDLTRDLVDVLRTGRIDRANARRIDLKIDGLSTKLSKLKRDVRAAAR